MAYTAQCLHWGGVLVAMPGKHYALATDTNPNYKNPEDTKIPR
jgi:hypothetical protein